MDMDWLILADSAQIVEGKLYLLGGGWDALTVTSGFPVSRRCGIAAAYSIPWSETGRLKKVEIDVITEDGVRLANITAQVEVGRPPGLPPGSTQRAQIAADLVLEINAPGTFAIVGRIEGQEHMRTVFRVVSTAAPASQAH
jgi:hypothetical protein